MFYQGGLIDNCTNVTGPVSQSSAESEYNVVCTIGMELLSFIILNSLLVNKDPDVVPEQAPLIILGSNVAVYMANNCKDAKHIRKFSSRMYFVRNGVECNLHNTVWCEVDM